MPRNSQYVNDAMNSMFRKWGYSNRGSTELPTRKKKIQVKSDDLAQVPAPALKINNNVLHERTSVFFRQTLKEKGYEVRKEQIEMALGIADEVYKRKACSIVVEAGVGVGKTYAYLVPLIYKYLLDRRSFISIVVSTATIALQDQLNCDCKALQKLMGCKINVTNIKGQTNYICLKKVEKSYGTQYAKKIERGIAQGKDDFAEENKELFKQCQITQYGKSCGQCEWLCEYRNKRRTARERGIVVCNHNFLIADRKKRLNDQNGLLPDGPKVIVIDEAHNFESKVRSEYTSYISEQLIVSVLSRMQNIRDISGENLKKINNVKKKTGKLFRHIANYVNEWINAAEDSNAQEREDATHIPIDQVQNNQITEDLHSLKRQLSDISITLLTLESKRTVPNSDQSATEDVDRVVDAISSFCNDNNVKWIEKSAATLRLASCPKRVDLICNKMFSYQDEIVIYTSATLADSSIQSQMYQYFIKSIGCESAICYGPFGSPFDYDSKAMLYCCDDLPLPNGNAREEFIRNGIKRIIELINLTQGKTLILFTSKEDMSEVRGELEKQKMPFPVLAQMEGSSQDAIISEFKQSENSVLLGTGTYWEGISIEGETLSSVIIFRLPFPVPDPIWNEKEKQYGNPLMELYVPEMIRKLKQGVGRLIRNATDKGIVSIIDSRLSDAQSKPYHDLVLDAIPIKNRTNHLLEIAKFYRKLTGGINFDNSVPIEGVLAEILRRADCKYMIRCCGEQDEYQCCEQEVMTKALIAGKNASCKDCMYYLRYRASP